MGLFTPRWLTGKIKDAYVVAASDSPNKLARSADYKCDGTADEVEIQAAIDEVYAAGGGTVRLLPGTYTVASTITAKSGVTIEGEMPISDGLDDDDEYNVPDYWVHLVGGTIIQAATTDFTVFTGNNIRCAGWKRIGFQGSDAAKMQGAFEFGADCVYGASWCVFEDIWTESVETPFKMYNVQHNDFRRCRLTKTQLGLHLIGKHAYCATGLCRFDDLYVYSRYDIVANDGVDVAPAHVGIKLEAQHPETTLWSAAASNVAQSTTTITLTVSEATVAATNALLRDGWGVHLNSTGVAAIDNATGTGMGQPCTFASASGTSLVLNVSSTYSRTVASTPIAGTPTVAWLYGQQLGFCTFTQSQANQYTNGIKAAAESSVDGAGEEGRFNVLIRGANDTTAGRYRGYCRSNMHAFISCDFEGPENDYNIKIENGYRNLFQGGIWSSTATTHATIRGAGDCRYNMILNYSPDVKTNFDSGSTQNYLFGDWSAATTGSRGVSGIGSFTSVAGLFRPSTVASTNDHRWLTSEGLTPSYGTIDLGTTSLIKLDTTTSTATSATMSFLSSSNAQVAIFTSTNTAVTQAITIPTPVGYQGVALHCVRSGVSDVVLTPTAGTISGAATKTLADQYAAITMVSDGTNWLQTATVGTVS